ncbi:phage head closure protein [Agrobacterium radiobacter]|jgi:SPP1 family predicted phage head-tail adaptor|uniref:phage head closure protein n=1 Tax=Agrobacterium radiobacter TaxID=362 RepID=UPI003466CD8F
MRSGKLDSKIKLQTSTHIVREDGVPIMTWTDFATVRAEILQSGTEQFYRAYGSVEEGQTIFRIRHLSGLNTSMRIIFEDRNYDIRKINEIRRKRGYEITAVAI